MKIHGSCHCANLSFELVWEPDPEEIPARACDCTFCRKHRGIWTSNPAASLDVFVAQPSLASTYAFGTRTAVFHLCTRCGVVPVVTSEIEGRVHAVVNVNAFDDVDPALLRHADVTFDGEDVAGRLSRRARHWIGEVRFIEGARPGAPAAPLPPPLK